MFFDSIVTDEISKIISKTTGTPFTLISLLNCNGHIGLLERLEPAYRVLALHAFRGVAGLQGQRLGQSPLGSQREAIT